MKDIKEYITENLYEAKDIDLRHIIDEVLSKHSIKDNEYSISEEDGEITIKFSNKIPKYDCVMTDIEKKIKDNKLGLKFYVTGDYTKKEPEIYINRY